MRGRMKQLYGFAELSFKRNLQYKASIIFRLISSFLYLVIQIFFWKMIYSNQSNEFVMSYSQMVSYIILSQSIGSLVFHTDYLYSIKQDLREGSIINHLVRPYNYMLRYMSESLGKYFVSFLVTVVPMLLLGGIFFHIVPPANAFALILSVMFAFLSFLIFFLVNFILGLTMFWVLDMNGLIPIITGCVFQICSGAILPLDYYPGVLRRLMYFLPFRFGADVPFNIYIGNISDMGDIHGYMALLLFWIVVLYCIEQIVWRKALRKLCIQGG